jgi:hypothetical protein
MPTTRPFEGIDNQVNVAEYDLIPLLATAKRLVNESEFVSKTDANNLGCKSTADRVQEIYRNTVNNLSYIDIKGFSKKIQNYVDGLMEWVLTTPKYRDPVPDGYEFKVRNIYSAIQVADKDIPLAVSTIGMYDRSLQKKKMDDIITDSEYVGEIDKRDEFFVKLIDKINRDDYIMYKCITKEHDLCIFFRSNDTKNDFDIELGDCFLMKATPKKHEISHYDDGARITKFNRVVFVKNYGQPA